MFACRCAHEKHWPDIAERFRQHYQLLSRCLQPTLGMMFPVLEAPAARRHLVGRATDLHATNVSLTCAYKNSVHKDRDVDCYKAGSALAWCKTGALGLIVDHVIKNRLFYAMWQPCACERSADLAAGSPC